jgi:hypothetical protein
MSKKTKKDNRKAGNASQNNGGDNGHTKQGRKAKRVDRKNLTGGTRSGFDHARPINNRKSKRHNSKNRKVTANKASGNKQTDVRTARPGNVPYEAGKKFVPWIEAPSEAQVHHYYFVMREMLEGALPADKKDPAHRLGEAQLDLHGTYGSVESMLTKMPRTRRDWRLVVGVLRMLNEDNLIPASFVEKVLASHPLTGAKTISVVEDTEVIQDYVHDKVRKSNKTWVEEAKASYAKALEYKQKDFVADFVAAEKVRFDGVPDEVFEAAALKEWDALPADRKVPTMEVNGDTLLCSSEDAYVTAHMTRRAFKEARQLPTLYRLSGGVSYDVMEDNKIVRKGDFVNIEYAVKKNGAVWLAVVYGGGKKKQSNSPFRKQFGRMSSHKDDRLYIDDIDKAYKHTTMEIQRAPVQVAPDIDDNTSTEDILKMMGGQRWEAASPKRRKKKSEKSLTMRQNARKIRAHRKTGKRSEGGRT